MSNGSFLCSKHFLLYLGERAESSDPGFAAQTPVTSERRLGRARKETKMRQTPRQTPGQAGTGGMAGWDGMGSTTLSESEQPARASCGMGSAGSLAGAGWEHLSFSPLKSDLAQKEIMRGNSLLDNMQIGFGFFTAGSYID